MEAIKRKLINQQRSLVGGGISKQKGFLCTASEQSVREMPEISLPLRSDELLENDNLRMVMFLACNFASARGAYQGKYGNCELVAILCFLHEKLQGIKVKNAYMFLGSSKGHVTKNLEMGCFIDPLK